MIINTNSWSPLKINERKVIHANIFSNIRMIALRPLKSLVKHNWLRFNLGGKTVYCDGKYYAVGVYDNMQNYNLDKNAQQP